MRLGADTLASRRVAYGLPQGSPANPILFALFLAPLAWGGRRTVWSWIPQNATWFSLREARPRTLP